MKPLLPPYPFQNVVTENFPYNCNNFYIKRHKLVFRAGLVDGRVLCRLLILSFFGVGMHLFGIFTEENYVKLRNGSFTLREFFESAIQLGKWEGDSESVDCNVTVDSVMRGFE